MTTWLSQLRGWFRRSPRTLRRPYRPRLEVNFLEDRLAPAAVPLISLAAPPMPLLGTTSVPVSLTFQNASANGATNPGFSPWAYAVLPNVGVDGHTGEGVSFDSSVTPNLFGAPVTFQTQTVPAGGSITGPAFALGTDGNPIVLTGLTPNNQVVFFQLPFGSYAVDQPGGVVNFAVNVSNAATIDAALTLTGGGGFSFGNDALNNPTVDPPIVAGTTTTLVTPKLFMVTKTYLGPEQETATGPNFKRQYEIDLTVANGQTIRNLTVTDLLPNNMQFVTLDSATANGGIFTGFTPPAPAMTPGGTLTVNFNQVVGTGGAGDASVVFTFYIPENDRSGNPVLPLGTGSFTTSTNNASGNGIWTNPFNPGEAFNVPVSDSADPNTITAQSTAVQKSVAVVGGGPVRQGSVLEYTINFQVSDYFAFNQYNVGDLLPDGVRFDQSFTPTLSVIQHTGNSLTAAFDTANYLSPPPASFNADGTQTLNFAVSNELITRGLSGNLIGGNIPPGGTGGLPPPDAFNAPLFSPGTTGTIVFRAIVQQQYDVTTSPEGNRDVKQGDTLTNVVPDATGPYVTVQPGGQVLNYIDLTGTGTFQADDSSATVAIATGQASKTIYAINGNTSVTSPYQVQAGDTVTYRLSYLLPTSTTENFVVTDYLPLPVFDATTVTTFDGTNATNTTAPAAGSAVFGPGVASPPAGITLPGGTVNYATIFPSPTNDPTVSSAAATNTVQFTFPTNLEDTQQRPSLVDLLFTVTVLDQPFGDGLFLTNQVSASESDTIADVTASNAIQQIQLTQPNLDVTKGVVSTDNPGNVFTPGTVGPVAFVSPGNTPGTAPPFTPVINSAGLAANPVNSNVSNLTSGNLVKFAVVVENTGLSVNGAFNVEVRDTLPAGFILPTNATGLNLQVFNGAGVALPFTSVNGGDTNPLFQSGIRLIDPSPTQGSLTAGQDALGNPVTSGTNIAVITYDLQIEPDNTQPDAVYPTEVLTNTATLFTFTATPGGTNYLPTPLTDPATATVVGPQLTKSLVSTSEASTTGSNVTIGEIVRYRLVVQLPASRSPSFQVVDALPTGQSYLGNATVAFVSSNGDNLFSSTLTGSQYYIAGTSPVTPDPTATIIGTSTGASGAPVTFALGNVTNVDMVQAVPEYVVIDFNALVLNLAPPNTAGRVANNNFVAQVNPGTGFLQIGPRSNNVSTTVVEPRVTTDKAVSPGTADIGDTVTYTVTYTSTGGTEAFIPHLTDTVPASISVSSVTATSTGGVVNLVNNSTGNVVDVMADNMPLGSVITVTVTGTVVAATVGVPIINTAFATWSSLPGGVGTIGGSNTTGQVTPGPDGATNGARNGNTGASGGAANTYNSSDSVPLNITAPEALKSLVATSEASTTGSNVAIGEIVRYQLAVRVPEGVSPNFQIVDALPTGLRFLGNTRVAFVSPTGTNLSSSDPAINSLAGLNFVGTSPNVTPTAELPAANISGGTGDGDDVTFSLGTITNTDASASNTNFVVIQFNALVDNVAPNQTGTIDTNTFTTRVNGSQVGPVSNAIDVVVVEPSITNTAKAVTSTLRDPSDPVTYRVTYSNTGNADAFDTRIVDVLPGTLTLNPASIVVRRNGVVIGTGFTNNSAGNTVDVTVARVAGTQTTGTGDTIEIAYTAIISPTTPAGTTIPNTANLTYTSLPGPNGTLVNPTGQSTPGAPGSPNGERNGSGGVINDYLGSASQVITVNASALSGFVYHDLNNNGIKDPGEPPIPGTTVTLTGRDFLGNTVTLVTMTDGTGLYAFANLLPSNSTGYTITETQPTGFINGKMTQPLNNFTGTIGLGSSVGTYVQFSDVYSRVVIGRQSNLVGSNYNFGEVLLDNVVPPAQVVPGDTPLLFCNGTPTQVSVVTSNPLEPLQVTLSVTPGSGTLTLSGTAGLTFLAGSDGSAFMTFRGTANHVNSALRALAFKPATYFSGPTTLTLTSTALNSAGNPRPDTTVTDTVAMTVAPRNHAPTVVVPPTQSTNQNVPLVFSVANGNAILLGDPDVNPAVQIFRLTLTATKGTATLATTGALASVTGNGTSSVTATGTLDALNAAVNGLVFTPALNTSGTASLGVTLNDLANTVGPALQTGKVVSINVAKVNQPPDVTGPTSVTRTAGSFVFTGASLLSVADVDAGSSIMQVTLTVPTGSLTLGTTAGLTSVNGNGTASITITGRLTYLNNALRGLRYTGGPTTLTVTANDLGNTGLGGPLTDVLSVSIL